MSKSRLVAILAVVATVAGLAACSTRPPSDEIMLYYTAGDTQNKKFQECVQPGEKGPGTVNNETFYLPTSLRTWNIRPEGGDSDQPIKSGTKPVEVTDATTGQRTVQPGAEVVVYATADFYLNTDCGADSKDPNSPIVQFWENTGRRPWKDGKGIASSGENNFHDDVWRVMLLNTLVPAEEKSLRQETRKYTADQLNDNLDGVWQTMERNLGPIFLQELRAKVGGDYFCGVGYKRGEEVEWKEWVADPVKSTDTEIAVKEETRRGKCPPVRISIIDVNFADQGIADARAAVFKAEQEAKAKLIRANAEKQEADILGQAANSETALKYKQLEAQVAAAEACRANPNCTVIIDGRGNTILPGR